MLNERGYMKRLALLAVAVLAACVFSAVAPARTATATTKCFQQTPATCKLISATRVVVDTRAGMNAGAYLSTWAAMAGVEVGHANFSFSYECLDVNNCLAAGSPQLAIPFEENGTFGGYVYVDALGCSYTSDQEVMHTVSTANPCLVTESGNGITDANWSVFASAHPTARIANRRWYVIAGQPYYGYLMNLRGWRT